MDHDRMHDGFNTLLGIEVTQLSSDDVVIRLPIDGRLHQVHGIVHGGVWCTLVETAASIAAKLWYEDGDAVGVSNTTDFLRAVQTGVVTARAIPIHRGRLQQLWSVEVREDDGGQLVARGQVRLQNLPSASGPTAVRDGRNTEASAEGVA